jgi:plasmid stabilization system protein ParE
MKLPVAVNPGASLEVREAHAWYEEQSPGLGEGFEAALHACFEEMRQRPYAFPLVTEHARRASVARFPYLVFYEVTEAEIIVHSVSHTSRNPDVWKRRVSA